MQLAQILSAFLVIFFSGAISLSAEQVAAPEEGKEKISKGTKEKFSKRNSCCKLGREVAKIGDVCSYEASSVALKPNPKQYHVLKTRMWRDEGANPINNRRLEKCKRFKAYYEKCCRTESASIARDIQHIRKDLKRFLRKHDTPKTNNEAKGSEGNGASGETMTFLMIEN